MFECKILAEKDSALSGKFDLESLEAALNAYASEGWRVVDSVVAGSAWKSFHFEIIVVLERVVT